MTRSAQTPRNVVKLYPPVKSTVALNSLFQRTSDQKILEPNGNAASTPVAVAPSPQSVAERPSIVTRIGSNESPERIKRTPYTRTRTKTAPSIAGSLTLGTITPAAASVRQAEKSFNFATPAQPERSTAYAAPENLLPHTITIEGSTLEEKREADKPPTNETQIAVKTKTHSRKKSSSSAEPETEALIPKEESIDKNALRLHYIFSQLLFLINTIAAATGMYFLNQSNEDLENDPYIAISGVYLGFSLQNLLIGFGSNTAEVINHVMYTYLPDCIALQTAYSGMPQSYGGGGGDYTKETWNGFTNTHSIILGMISTARFYSFYSGFGKSYNKNNSTQQPRKLDTPVNIASTVAELSIGTGLSIAARYINPELAFAVPQILAQDAGIFFITHRLSYLLTKLLRPTRKVSRYLISAINAIFYSGLIPGTNLFNIIRFVLFSVMMGGREAFIEWNRIIRRARIGFSNKLLQENANLRKFAENIAKGVKDWEHHNVITFPNFHRVLYNPDGKPLSSGIKRTILGIMALYVGSAFTTSISSGLINTLYAAITLATYGATKKIVYNPYQEFLANQNPSSFLKQPLHYIKQIGHYLFHENPVYFAVSYGYGSQIWDELLGSNKPGAKELSLNYFQPIIFALYCMLWAMARATNYEEAAISKNKWMLIDAALQSNPSELNEIKLTIHEQRAIARHITLSEDEKGAPTPVKTVASKSKPYEISIFGFFGPLVVGFNTIRALDINKNTDVKFRPPNPA